MQSWDLQSFQNTPSFVYGYWKAQRHVAFEKNLLKRWFQKQYKLLVLAQFVFYNFNLDDLHTTFDTHVTKQTKICISPSKSCTIRYNGQWMASNLNFTKIEE